MTGAFVNNCNANIDNAQPLDKKAALKVKFPKVFECLGKLKGYQLKLHQAIVSHPRRFARQEEHNTVGTHRFYWQDGGLSIARGFPCHVT